MGTMFICVCKAVTDKRIQRAVQCGEVLSLRELTREFGVGTCCGKCVPTARGVLMEALAQRVDVMSSPASPMNVPATMSA